MAPNDQPGTETDVLDPVCPACGAEEIEPAPDQAHAYQCVRCGALFDADTV